VYTDLHTVALYYDSSLKRSGVGSVPQQSGPKSGGTAVPLSVGGSWVSI